MAGFPPLPLREPTGWDGHDTDEKYSRLAALRRGDICRDVADAVQRAVNHERSRAAAPDGLDVERLADALLATGALWSANVYYEVTTDAHEFAIAIAAEYRAATPSHPATSEEKP